MKKSPEICQTCHVGQLRPRLTTYAAWHALPAGDGTAQGIFVVAQGVPAWVCSVCGAHVFERAVMDRLVMLAGPPAGLSGADEMSGSTRRPAASQEGGSPLRRAQ